MKKLLAIILLATMMFTIGGCGQKPADPSTTGAGTAADGKEPIKVALALTGPINDGGWCAIAYEGLKNAEDTYGIQTAYSENVQATEMEALFTEFAAQDYDLVIGHGFQFGDPALSVGSKYPNTKFVCIEGGAEAENVASYVMKCEEAGYLMGMLAGGMSESGKIGMVSALEGPSLIKIVEAYKLGAKEVNPSVEVQSAYTGSFDDIARAKEAALSMINSGADVVAHCANQAGMGAIKAAQESGILATGDSFDQNSIAPETVMGSTIYNVPFLIETAVKDVIDGTFKGEIKELGMAEGIIDIAGYNSFEDKIPQELKTKISDRKMQIASGEFKVPKVVEITK